MITVMGATGNTGRRITELLLAGGEHVRGIGRSASKLARLDRDGAKALAGDAADPAFLTEAFDGADAVYTMLPIDPGWADFHAEADRLGEAIVTAVRDAGVRNVVALSSVGADLPAGTGFIASLHAQEQRLSRLDGVNLLVLRPGLFFESFRAALGLVKHQGINGDSVSPDVEIPMVATHDVANVAAQALLARDWTGVAVRELLGPRDLSYAEVTAILGERIGRPDLPYVQFSYADMARTLTQVGFSDNVAELHVEMTRALNEGTVASREGRNHTNTTPTRFEDFAGELARAYRA